MREIKFRVWDKETKTMHKLLNIKFCDRGYRLSVPSEAFTGCHIIVDNAVLMQYTGLTDKNGKDVYEGDIVKYGFNSGVYEDVYASIECREAHLGFRLNADCISRHMSRNMYIANTELYEVVGNIYETPGLEGEYIANKN